MGETTAISWTDHTFNPWWGCTRVSPACDHCYAEAFAKRTGHDVWGKDGPRRFLSDNNWRQPLRWDETARIMGRPALVFCASMADVFESHIELRAERLRLWRLIEETPHLIWQLLTKRPQNVLAMVPRAWLEPRSVVTAGPTVHQVPGWPPNVWIGTTIEDPLRARVRLPQLLAIPAPVRFVSAEPLLGPVSLLLEPCPCLAQGPRYSNASDPDHDGSPDSCELCDDSGQVPGVHWVIVGGESGAGHRTMNLDHARRLRDQCDDFGIPFFFKQHGGRTPTAGGHELDGRVHHAFPPEARRLALAGNVEPQQ